MHLGSKFRKFQIGFVFLFGCLFSTRAQQFEVDGQIIFSTPGKQPSHTYFRAIVDGCRWNIKLTQDSKTLYDYEEISFDGEYSYNVSFTESSVDERRKRGEKVGDNVATAWITKEPFFRSIFVHEAGPIWLAYASQCFFSDFTNKVIEPIIAYNCEPIPSPTSKLGKQRIDWNRFQDFPYLPNSIIFYDLGSTLTEPFRKRQPPYYKGFTNVIFDVVGTTNFSGMVLPTDVTVNVFCPRQNGLGLLCSYEISNVRIKSNPINFAFKPTIPGLTYVTDGRFVPEAGLISYPIKTNWLSESEVRSFPQFANGKIVASIIERNVPLQQANAVVVFFIRCFLFVTILAGPIFIWRFAVKSKKTKMKE